MKKALLLILLTTVGACSGDNPPATTDAADQPEAPAAAATQATDVEAYSPDGTPLRRPAVVPNAAKLEADLAEAKLQLEQHPEDPDSLIWYGRRLGYLWRFQDAIDTFTRGIEQFPDEPRFYRHRGHRYLSVRDFPKAQADFERAVELMRGKPDEIEPDGAPNPAGIPRGTLHFNVWYHLGLAYYLQGDYERALNAYQETLKVSDNDDSIVATKDWMWMSLMRLDRKDEANALLADITPDMDILENDGYHRRLLMYKGLETPDALMNTANADSTMIATQGYGVGNYYLVKGEMDKAREVFNTVTSGEGWPAFGYIAAETDLARMD